jgi:hypothetical protein
MHGALERYIRDHLAGEPSTRDIYEHEAVEVFAEWAVENVATFIWAEAHCFSEETWTGGISDCGALLYGGRVSVIDFKSSREAYFSQFVQAGGYALQIEQNGLVDAQGQQIGGIGPTEKIDSLMVFPFGGDTGPVEITVQQAFIYVNLRYTSVIPLSH